MCLNYPALYSSWLLNSLIIWLNPFQQQFKSDTFWVWRNEPWNEHCLNIGYCLFCFLRHLFINCFSEGTEVCGLSSEFQGQPGAESSLRLCAPSESALASALRHYARLFPEKWDSVWCSPGAEWNAPLILNVGLPIGKSDYITLLFRSLQGLFPDVLTWPSPPCIIWTLFTFPEPFLASPTSLTEPPSDSRRSWPFFSYSPQREK